MSDFIGYRFFLFLYFFLCFGSRDAFSFAGGLHLRSTNDVLKEISKNKDIPVCRLTPRQKAIVKTGAVVADVGRFYLDSLFPASDDLEFIFHLKKHAKTFNEKLFVFGVQLHFWQDHYLRTFHKIVFGDDHKGSYFDYAKYDKWCLYDCNSQKICTGSLNSNRLDFDFSHINSVISKIYNWFYCLVARFLYPFLIKKYYSTGNFFKIDASCTDLLLQTYKSIAIEKGLNIMNINLTSELINKSIDTVVGAHAILSSLPFITLSDIEKLNAKKAYKQMQKNLIKKIKEYDWDLLKDDTLHRTDELSSN